MRYPIIDCHCHIYPDKIADKAVEAIGAFYNLPMCYDGRSSTMIQKSNSIGVVHNIIFSVATTPQQVGSINNFIAKCVEAGEGRFTGLGSLHPETENIAEEIATIKKLGLKGVKLHPDFQKFKIDDEKLYRIYELCSGELPIMLHTGDYRYDFSNPQRMARVLEKFPELTVIGAHFGGWSVWEEAADVLFGYENFYVDCSSSFHWLKPVKAKELIRKYGADKVLFGTDFPMWSYEDEFEYFSNLNLNEDENRKILFENAQNLFDIKI